VCLAIGLALVLQALVTLRSSRRGRNLDAMQMFVHDMRSPMQVVLAHLELLREALAARAPGTWRGRWTGRAGCTA
jgi:hypothetical protein